MKNSNIEWLGQIPKEWEVTRNKYVMKKVKQIREIWKGENVLSLTINGVIKRDLENPSGKMPATFDGYQFVKPNNLLMCLFDIDVTPRCIGLIQDEGVCSPAYSQYELLDKNASTKYFYYYYLNLDFTKELLHLAKNLRHSLGEDDFGQIPIIFSPLSEQQKIADFLDTKCAKIDSLKESIQTQIQTLEDYKKSLITQSVTKGLNPNAKTKQSGIEWLGQIPEEWKTVFCKYNFKIVSGSTPDSSKKEFWNGNIPWITPADYKTDDKYVSKGKRSITTIGYNSCSTNLIPKGSIIFSKRAPIGTVAINTNDLCTNQGCLACIPLSNLINIDYYFYFFSIGTEFYNLLGAGTTFKEISATAFENSKIPFPPLAEQQKIADFLDSKCASISSIITTKKQQLTKLEEYKKSLIYEYVTGKKRV